MARASLVYDGQTYYIQSTGRYFQNGNRKASERLLHRYIWTKHRGEIPEGYDIHHKNENWEDNSLSNLCIMPKGDHLRLHLSKRLKNPHYYRTRLRQLKVARESAKAWHSSEEGIKWHREHAKESLRLTPKKERTCIHCGHKWKTTYHHAKFCCRSCSSCYYIMHKARKDERLCGHCGKKFLVPYMRKTRFCSPQCTAWGVAKIKMDKKKWRA